MIGGGQVSFIRYYFEKAMRVLLRTTRPSEIDRIMEILAEGRKSLASMGIDQWQGGYPHEDIIKNDIATGVSYVVEEDGSLVATAMIGFTGEKDYDHIEEGAWLTSSTCKNPDYAVVHRVAVSQSFRTRGAASFLLRETEDIVVSSGYGSIRIDTHPGNIPMRSLLEKEGYKQCGIIYIEHAEESTPERIAYEKILH